MNEAPRPPSSRKEWGWVAALLAASTLLAFALDAQVSLTSLAMIYLLAVVVASYLLGWVQAAVTAVTAVTALNFLFVPPRWTLVVESRDHLIALTAMLIVSLVISHLGSALRREAALARLNAQRAHRLQALATALAGVATAGEVQALGLTALNGAFAGPVRLAWCDDQGQPDPTPDWHALERDGAHQCVKEKAVLGPGTGRWPGLGGWYLPVGDGGHVLGVALVQPALAADTDGRLHAVALVALLGQALRRLQLDSAMRLAQAEAQRQQLLNTFLAAISHDLRTPLAAIMGAGTSLQTQWQRLGEDARARLLGSMVSESSRLVTLTENTLQLVRLSALEVVGIQRPWESPEEMVGAAVTRARAQGIGQRISVRVAPKLPLVQADPVLIGQMLANLLDNALKYSEGPVVLGAHLEGDHLALCVKDRGAGIDLALKATMFQPFSRGDHAGLHGAGLGLALCQAIAQAHGGHMAVRERQGGGMSFCLLLPVPPQPDAGDDA